MKRSPNLVKYNLLMVFQMESKYKFRKSKIVHFRQIWKQQSNFQFKYGSTILEYCQYFKNLGLYLDANLNFNNGIKTLADSGG